MQRFDIFGYPVDGFDKKTLLDFINSRIENSDKTIIAHLNLHGIYCLLKSAVMTKLFARLETFVHIDGMPIVWLLRLKGAAITRDNRLTYLDWATDLIALAEQKNWRVAYIGSTKEICDKGVEYFKNLHPGLQLRGWDGFFDMNDTEEGSRLCAIIGDINAYQPDLLIVGMGMPRQETFFQQNFDRLSFSVGLCSGAFFEYFVGGQAMPPRWTGRMGVEWFYRLASNPKRYATRYIIEPWQIIYLLVLRGLRNRQS